VIIHGDARQIPLPNTSVDAIVTDPPYELGFMGKRWDSTGVAYDPATWREALRVLKPGGILGRVRRHPHLAPVMRRD
jgi:DNA modification methylase